MAMILSAFVPGLMRNLSQMAQHQVGQLLGVPGEVDKLTCMVHQIQCVLVDAEKRQNESESIKSWVMQLKDIMYDVDNVIDLCRIKSDERRARSGSSSSSKTRYGIHFLSCFRNPFFAHEIAGQIKEINSRMNVIVSQIGFMGLIGNTCASSEARQMASNISRETHSVVVLSDLVGVFFEEDTDILVELLTKNVTQGQGNIPIVAVVGMGGIGKTTLAKMVYNDPRIQENFEHLIWVCVSKTLKQVDLLKNVIREVGGDCGGAEKISELMPRLEQYIRGKKIFLVLDDIWPESEEVWYGLLRDPMINKGVLESRVLITTRDDRVAMRMGAIHTLKVKRLSDEDGWSLLIKKVDPNGVESEIQDLKDIGMQIVRKCDGLPLAIKSIGGVLCMKDKTRVEWEAVLKSNMWSIDGVPSIHHAFHLSYEDLSSPLKQCFIFCSLFPEDYWFYKSKLIYMWLAEGFLQDKGDFWELGTKYYNELLFRNLLEAVEASYNQLQCKMHDMLWSLARQLGKDENYVLWKGQALSKFEGSLKVRRLSVEGHEVDTEVIKKEKGLRTLLLQFKPEIELDDLCKAFSNLRILDLSNSNFSSLPNSLCNLMHLRYLDVSDSKLRNIPNNVGNLRNLVYFCCSNCKELSYVPQGISNLRELRCLSFQNTMVEAIPRGLNNLEKLTGLYGFKPYKTSLEGFSSLDGLESLLQLITLYLEGLERLYDRNIAKRANLRSKNRLQTLSLGYTYLSCKDQVSQTNEKKMTIEDVLNELCPPSCLEIIIIEGYFGSHLPNWLSLRATLPNLRYLNIYNCACFEGLPPLGQLPNLDWLQIYGAYSVVSVGEEFLWGDIQSIDTMSYPAKPAFPKLSKLIFEGMPNWKEWQWNKRQPAMPKLKELFIRACPQLRSLPEGLSHHATSLENLDIQEAKNLITIENLPSIKHIRVVRNPILERISNLANVSFIAIEECLNLKAVENLKALQTMALIDYKMKFLPNYLTMIMPQKLRIQCSEELLLDIATQGKSSSEWCKFEHITTMKIFSLNKSFCATYQKMPFSFTANISTAQGQFRDDVTTY